MTPTRVVVTGASGFIGSVVTPFLTDAGFDVVPRDLGLYADCGFPEGRLDADGWDTRTATPDDFVGVDAVVHLAALSNDPVGELSPETTHAINHVGTLRVAESAKAAGVSRFVFASSCSLYGAAAGSGLVDETAPMAPVTPYAESKVTGEAALKALADDAFSPVLLRNATVYGPSPGLRLDVVVNNLCASAVATGKILMMSDGSPWRPQVHVTDVARAIIAALEAPREVVHGEAFNVGRGDENLRIAEIAEIIAEASGASITFDSGAAPDPRSYRVDFTKIEHALPAFVPKWTVAEGVRELIELFGTTNLQADQFTRYTRLHEIRRLRAQERLGSDLTWR